jgi:hypothetical protein
MCVYNLKIYILYFLYWIYTKKIRISSTHLHKYIKSRRKYQKFPDPRFIHFFWVLKEMEQSGIIFPRFNFNSAPNRYTFIRVTPEDTSILFQTRRRISQKML